MENQQPLASFMQHKDPWVPIEIARLQTAPNDPKYSFISSENYIDSLEKKLNRIKGKTAKEPTTKEMIDSLNRVRDDQMSTFLNTDSGSRMLDFSVDVIEPSAGAFLQRRLHPERQAVNSEELVHLLKEDALSKSLLTESSEKIEDTNAEKVINKSDLNISTT